MIESSQNEAIKILRRVRRSRGAEAVLEGPHLVLEALRLGLRLQPVVATEEFLASAAGEEVRSRLPRPPLVAPREFSKGWPTPTPPADCSPSAACRGSALEEVTPRPNEIWLYLDQIQDPGNLGALARVAEGLGAAGLLLSPGCADPYHPRALRASAGQPPARARRRPGRTGRRAPSASRCPRPGRRGRAATRWIGLEAHAGALPLDELATGEAAAKRPSSRSARRAPGSPRRRARSCTPA